MARRPLARVLLTTALARCTQSTDFSLTVPWLPDGEGERGEGGGVSSSSLPSAALFRTVSSRV